MRDPIFPKRTRRNAAESWIPKGTSCRVADRDIAGGMVYVGTGLRSVNGFDIEPALVDPRLPVAPGAGATDGSGMGYWPSYSEIAPEHRAAYLRWLVEGRRHPDAYIGYVFLFLYGLERRLLAPGIELQPEEYEGIATELEELLDVYGTNRSFRGYAGTLYEEVVLPHVPERIDRLSPPSAPAAGDIPTSVRVAIGHAAATGKPIPAEWAYAWLTSHPLTRLGTAANRCRSDFRRLFCARYASRFGHGVVVRGRAPESRTRYQPASSSFGGPVSVTSTGAPIRRLPDEVPVSVTRLAQECATDLEPYSRWLGRNPGDEKSMAALALLPHELFGMSGTDAASDLGRRLTTRIGPAGLGVLKGSDLLSDWPLGPDGKLGKADFVGLAQLLERLSLGVEPDVRFLGPRFDHEAPIVVFRLPEGAGPAASRAYASALLLVQLTAVVAAADGAVSDDEEARLVAHLESAFRLIPAEKARLRARLRWQAAAKARLTIKEDGLAGLSAESRQTLGSYLVGVAAADGTVTREEIQALEKLFKRIGLDPSGIATEMHELALAEGLVDRPVTILPGESAERQFKIPGPAATPRRTGHLQLDARLVDRKLQQTREVTALLATVFAEEETAAAPPPSPREGAVSGLDPAHGSLLRSLGIATEWPRASFDELATQHGLLPAGAIDVLNEAAIDKTGRPVLEDEDPLLIDREIIEEMLR
ncbi:MAG: TerB N-terminal domain-containing protein [Candidatus Eisenbacteria bacterium]|nr:TerB N-terminal domain-containing protein [Candidatus Eisenbacteria bacterium]